MNHNISTKIESIEHGKKLLKIFQALEFPICKATLSSMNTIRLCFIITSGFDDEYDIYISRGGTRNLKHSEQLSLGAFIDRATEIFSTPPSQYETEIGDTLYFSHKSKTISYKNGCVEEGIGFSVFRDIYHNIFNNTCCSRKVEVSTIGVGCLSFTKADCDRILEIINYE